MSTRSVIVAGARTPIGKFAGGFKELKAVDLGAVAIREAVARSGVDGASRCSIFCAILSGAVP